MLALLLACQGDGGGPSPDTGTGPTTAETGDTGSSATGGRLFDEEHVLVVPDTAGIRLLGPHGHDRAIVDWTTVLGEGCFSCTGEGASADGDGLLVSFAFGFASGGIARLRADGTPEFALVGLGFPHDAVRDPADGTILVPEAQLDRIVWLPGDGSSLEPVRTLDGSHPDWQEEVPNGVERIDLDGRTCLLSSNRGAPGQLGRVSMWDITDAGAPALLWKFPEGDPGLAIPHGPVFRRWEGRWWLLWAHSEGSATGATVGLAVTDDVTVRPEYVADLEADGDAAPFAFLRGVELTDDGWLWLTDTGVMGFPASLDAGRLFKARMPSGLAPSGLSGTVPSGQTFLSIEAELVEEGLGMPFEGWLWVPPPTFPQ